MKQIDKDRFFNMAECYDRMAPYCVPQYDWLQKRVVDMIADYDPMQPLIVDLGGGSGIFLERILDRIEGSRVVWVDFSPDFEDVARRRLARWDGRVEFINCRLEDDWESRLPSQPSAICSMSAIHHLNTAQKISLYQRCYSALTPGGWFFNIDEMSTLYEDAYVSSLQYWARHVDNAGSRIDPELATYYDAFRERFDRWKIRNIENRNHPKETGDDTHEGYIEQMKWLKEAGFAEVDLFIKFRLWSVIGGIKGGGENSGIR